MKQILVKLAARVGLVPARRVAILQDRIKELQRESKTWERKSGELKKQVHQSEVELRRHIELLRHARADVQRLRVREEELGTVLERLSETERALAVAREQLTAVEVKLDILEGAANILDLRTRAVPTPQRKPDNAGAAV